MISYKWLEVFYLIKQCPKHSSAKIVCSNIQLKKKSHKIIFRPQHLLSFFSYLQMRGFNHRLNLRLDQGTWNSKNHYINRCGRDPTLPHLVAPLLCTIMHHWCIFNCWVNFDYWLLIGCWDPLNREVSITKLWSSIASSLHPNISISILHTVFYTFPIVLMKRICLTIKNLFSWWSFPLSLWP